MSWISQLSESRKLQLAQEELVDKRLSAECNTQCSLAVREFMFNMRNFNRLSSLTIYNAPFYKYPPLIRRQLEFTNTVQTTLLQTNSDPFALCRALKQINQDIETEIKTFIH